MSLRETLEKKQGMVMGVCGGVIGLAVLWIGWSLLSGGKNTGPAVLQAYYTIDDGKNYFPDADFPNKISPFTKEGKPAYKVFVWTCDGGKTKIVSGLQRFVPVAQAKLQEAIAKKDDEMIAQIENDARAYEYKAPNTGDDPKNWIKGTDTKTAKLIEPNCPNGGMLEAVTPQ
ncbi:MAG TPA: hypothetical protein VHD56_09085 [Tepidisphaeraceae bacterium]|nr:hypothetical protein [Tepidisphaeraceae bacterium]